MDRVGPGLYALGYSALDHFIRRGQIALKKSNRGPRAQKLQAAVASETESRSHGLEEANKTAGFVAHELNNLLTVIQINTEFLLEPTSENPESAEELEEIQRASKRASILARQLLASSRLEPFDPAVAGAGLTRKRTRTPTGKSRAIGDEKPPRTAESILLVEDEAAVRSLAKKILLQKGYRVLE